ncbi:hypothetical protein ACFWB3_07070 [[Kitasatospora] papulosa]|uniref:hypothetical protein n=1 Tax=[Kitasatospora] papulosa TaxID=1464011 RepID=UPI0036BF69E3
MPLAAAWFARGVSPEYLTSALLAGLPEPIGSPVGLMRRRLTDKMPPQLPVAPSPAPGSLGTTPALGFLSNVPTAAAPADALPDGLCRACRTTPQPTESPDAGTPDQAGRDVPALVASLRNLMRTP